MKKVRFTLNVLAVAIFTLAASSLAHAQATRTWVSGVGDDANPCSRTAPCKTFAGAISKTATNGEISALDPGGFGAVTITKGITISGDGTLAGILNAGGVNGIIVNAPANDVVTIRSISIHGGGTGLNGIRYLGGKRLNVENCTISGFTNRGIDVSPTSAPGKVAVRNTTIIGNSGAGVETGVVLAGSGAGAGVEVDLFNVRLQGLNLGLEVRDTGGGATPNKATISNSTVSNNTAVGLIARGNGIINVESTTLAHNVIGVQATDAGSKVRLSRTAIFNNGTGISIGAGGIVTTFQNNVIFGNTTDGAPNDNKTQQ